MDDSAKICAQHGGEVEGFETPEECRSKGYTCPWCAEGDHRNCARLICACLCEEGMSLALGYLWKQRAQTATDEVKRLERLNEVLREELAATRRQMRAENERLSAWALRACTFIQAATCRCWEPSECDAHSLIFEYLGRPPDAAPLIDNRIGPNFGKPAVNNDVRPEDGRPTLLAGSREQAQGEGRDG